MLALILILNVSTKMADSTVTVNKATSMTEKIVSTKMSVPMEIIIATKLVSIQKVLSLALVLSDSKWVMVNVLTKMSVNKMGPVQKMLLVPIHLDHSGMVKSIILV